MVKLGVTFVNGKKMMTEICPSCHSANTEIIHRPNYSFYHCMNSTCDYTWVIEDDEHQ